MLWFQILHFVRFTEQGIRTLFFLILEPWFRTNPGIGDLEISWIGEYINISNLRIINVYPNLRIVIYLKWRIRNVYIFGMHYVMFNSLYSNSLVLYVDHDCLFVILVIDLGWMRLFTLFVIWFKLNDISEQKWWGLGEEVHKVTTSHN